MRKLVLFLAFLAVVGMLRANNSFARIDRVESCQEEFERIDFNNDGVISLSEYSMEFHKGRFAGPTLSPSGNEAWVIFGRMDVDGSGYLTPQQYCG